MSLKSRLQTVADVFHHYPYKVKRINNEPSLVKKGVWVVDTDAGRKVLRRLTTDENRMNFLLEAVQYLRDNGVLVMGPLPTTSGGYFVKEDGAFFTVGNSIADVTFDYHRQVELKALMEGLAKFHRAAQGFRPKSVSATIYKLGSWSRMWGRHGELLQELAPGLKGGRILADTLIARELDYFWERSVKLTQALAASQYGAWSEQIRNTGGLCHQEFYSGHVILQSDSAPYLVDWGKMCVDLPARDLRKTCLKIMQYRGEWKPEVLLWLFRCYQAIHPLTQEQWRVVLLDMKYPHQFFYALHKYHQKRQRGWIDSRYGPKIKEVIKAERTKNRCLDHLDLSVLA